MRRWAHVQGLLVVCVGPKVIVLTFVHCLKEESVSVLTQLIEIGGVKSPLLKKVRAMHNTEWVRLSGLLDHPCKQTLYRKATMPEGRGGVYHVLSEE